jgi:hypothetical protein
MLSKRFFAWVGVGILGVAAIPAIAAPHLSRLALRHGTGAQALGKPAATPVRSVVSSRAKKPVATAHKTVDATAKKTSPAKTTTLATKSPKVTAKKTLPKASAKTAAKKTVVSKPKLAAGKKPTAAATAKKLLH